MLFAAFVLVTIDREHDGLQERIDLCHSDKPTKVRDVARLGLQEEEEIPIFLLFLVIGEEAFL